MPFSSYNFVFMMSDKISNSQIKHLRALQLKKFRQKYNQFIVEGIKSVDEFIGSSLKCLGLYGNEEAISRFHKQIDSSICFQTNTKQLTQISGLKNPQGVLGVFEMPSLQTLNKTAPLILLLDDIRDPGNLGTIVRTAEWFGLDQVVCSTTSVDCFNAKVIQASMGSLSRVKVHYRDLPELVKELPEHVLLQTDMVGEDYRKVKINKCMLVIGNEGKGVSDELAAMAHQTITIPRKGEAESLNAAISAAILLAELT